MEYADVIVKLKHHEALNILLWLGEDDSLRERILARAGQALRNFDEMEISDRVFRSLNSIDVEDLWDRSGKTRYGYNDPSEEAACMLEEEVQPFLQVAEDYRSLGMKGEERKYTQAVYAGVMRYADEGDNEFRGWAPDDPYVLAENIHYDWKKHNAEGEWALHEG